MRNGHSDLVDVDAELRMERDRRMAIYAGTDDARGREVWTWLPKSLVEDNRDGTFTMPEWLAKKEGLI